MFIKRRDGLEDPRRDVTIEDRSILSGLRIEDLGAGLRPLPNAHAALRPTAEGVPGARRTAFPTPYEPMLPTLTREVFQRSDWLYEPKLVGYRVLAFVRDGQVPPATVLAARQIVIILTRRLCLTDEPCGRRWKDGWQHRRSDDGGSDMRRTFHVLVTLCNTARGAGLPCYQRRR